MSDFDLLRLPSALDPTAPAYKDWVHLNLFDHASGSVGLVNVSLHGAPTDARARAVGTALFHEPGHGWHGNVEIAGFGDATVGPEGVLLAQVAMSVDPTRRILHASARLPQESTELRLAGTVAARPIRVELAQPFGSGWIAWYVAPRVQVEGRLKLRDRDFDLASWSAYYDHNWGRWFWGEDIGWEWAAFATRAPGPLFVLARLTDRLHRRLDPAQLIVVQEGRSRTFQPGCVAIRHEGRAEPATRRLPGALAALHSDRRKAALPARLAVEAVSGPDWVRLSFATSAAAQLIEGDPICPGYAFIYELVGEFEASGRVGDRDVAARGLGVFEYVA